MGRRCCIARAAAAPRRPHSRFSRTGSQARNRCREVLAYGLLHEDCVFRHILVPIDLSDRHQRVIDVARGIAAAAGARLTVMHVVQRIEGIPPRELQSFYARLEQSARKRLERTVHTLAAGGLRVRLRLVIGDPAAEILREARTRAADLLVLGSHHLGRTPGSGLGTTSYKVGLLCRCPVLLVK